MWRSLASNALTVFTLALIAVLGVVTWGERSYNGPGPLSKPICTRIERGDSLAAVSKRLEKEGVIDNALVFRLGAEYGGKGRALKFGSYLMPKGASMAQIVEIITRGGQSTCGTEINYRIGVTDAEMIVRTLDPVTDTMREEAKFDPTQPGAKAPQAYLDAEKLPDVRLRIILAEGVTSWQVVNALKSADFMKGKAPDVPPEGSLAPESYEITPKETRSALIAQMQARQKATLARLWAGRAKGLPYKDPEQALIMASLIEKETGLPKERPLVASVFLNRLDKGIRLQTDPAVIYGITKGKGTLGRGLRQSELRSRVNRYNTYVFPGLPPTPIANPGAASIEAALHPADTKYLYFVANGTGGHAFAETLAEHNRNVAKWRALQAARQKAGQTGSAP